MPGVRLTVGVIDSAGKVTVVVGGAPSPPRPPRRFVAAATAVINGVVGVPPFSAVCRQGGPELTIQAITMMATNPKTRMPSPNRKIVGNAAD